MLKKDKQVLVDKAFMTEGEEGKRIAKGKNKRRLEFCTNRRQILF